jgi:hypothetical protein
MTAAAVVVALAASLSLLFLSLLIRAAAEIKSSSLPENDKFTAILLWKGAC